MAEAVATRGALVLLLMEIRAALGANGGSNAQEGDKVMGWNTSLISALFAVQSAVAVAVTKELAGEVVGGVTGNVVGLVG
jgi:hypothetical protein